MQQLCQIHREKLSITRRVFVRGGLASTLTLAGCQTFKKEPVAKGPPAFGSTDYHALAYSAKPDERFPLPALNLEAIDPQFLRQRVNYPSGQRPGTIIVEPHEHFLYFIEANEKAIRYGVGVGRAGFAWSGVANIAFKRQWPTWTPPATMISREPELSKWAKGMPPSLENPLGARALYIYQDGYDTLYRLHGTNNPKSIGKSLSSGCIRLWNQDITDLYERTQIGARIIVKA